MMMAYAIFTPSGMPLVSYTAEVLPTLEQMADHCVEINGFTNRDESVTVKGPEVLLGQYHTNPPAEHVGSSRCSGAGDNLESGLIDEIHRSARSIGRSLVLRRSIRSMVFSRM